MLTLRPLSKTDKESFLNAVSEFKAHDPFWEFAFSFKETDDYDRYIETVEDWANGRHLAPGHVPASCFVAVVDGKIIGRVSIRHTLNDFLMKVGGHIGYGVIPSCRRKGYATEILRQSLPIAKSLGINRLLLTCDEGNVGSYRTIEKNGGVLEKSAEGKRRYWFDLS
jgi:predicted acetyltransferase